MRKLAIAMGALVIALTLFADLGDPSALTFVRRIPGRDLTAHFVLFGLLSFLSVSSIRRSTSVEGWRARVRWAGVLALLVALEEGSQAFIPSRSFSVLDLSASWAGILFGLTASTLWLWSHPEEGRPRAGQARSSATP